MSYDDSHTHKIRTLTVWLARDAAGTITGGAGYWSITRGRTRYTWALLPGTLEPTAEVAAAFAELCTRAHGTRLMFVDVDERPWPDAAGPWRIEAPLHVLVRLDDLKPGA